MTWGTPVQSFVFLGLLVFELEPMYATSDGQTDGRTTDADHRIMPPRRGHNKDVVISLCSNFCRRYDACLLTARGRGIQVPQPSPRYLTLSTSVCPAALLYPHDIRFRSRRRNHCRNVIDHSLVVQPDKDEQDASITSTDSIHRLPMMHCNGRRPYQRMHGSSAVAVHENAKEN